MKIFTNKLPDENDVHHISFHCANFLMQCSKIIFFFANCALHIKGTIAVGYKQ